MNTFRAELFRQYLALLQKWNTHYNLTSIVDTREIETHHFDDSLAPLPFVEKATTLIDLGTGAGFPGIPLKIAAPHLDVTLIDATRKKISFCNEVIRTLKLQGIRAVQGRAEDTMLVRQFNPFDVVISRATWPLGVLLEMADLYFDEHGRCIAMRGARWREELTETQDIIARHKLALDTTHPYTIAHGEQRCLLIFRKNTV
jgi:16S rRNA (guanine527-N7)-methyltransferase